MFIVNYPPGETIVNGKIVTNAALAADICSMPLEDAIRRIHDLRCMQGDAWQLKRTDTIEYYKLQSRERKILGEWSQWRDMLQEKIATMDVVRVTEQVL